MTEGLRKGENMVLAELRTGNAPESYASQREGASLREKEISLREGTSQREKRISQREKGTSLEEKVDSAKEASFRDIFNTSMGTDRNGKVPYGYLAKDGIIEYNGMIFVCDSESHSICLGDMSDKKKVLTIPLSKGGNLMVNRGNIGELSKAIGMFSPEDVNRILRAIAQDAQAQRKLNELEETKDDPHMLDEVQ